MSAVAKAAPTRWRDAIRRAQKTAGPDKFTAQEKAAAADWVTCACGEQDPRIPRGRRNSLRLRGLIHEPDDEQLRDLGLEFAAAVGHDNPWEAATILEAIEQRAGVILRGLAS